MLRTLHSSVNAYLEAWNDINGSVNTGTVPVEESARCVVLQTGKCIFLPTRCKPLNLVHNAQYAKNMKSCICSLEPSWIAM
eukprot:245289-Ditylum_brightwellii.AAC.1